MPARWLLWQGTFNGIKLLLRFRQRSVDAHRSGGCGDTRHLWSRGGGFDEIFESLKQQSVGVIMSCHVSATYDLQVKCGTKSNF